MTARLVGYSRLPQKILHREKFSTRKKIWTGEKNSPLEEIILNSLQNFSTGSKKSRLEEIILDRVKKPGLEKMILDWIKEFWTRQKNYRPLLSVMAFHSK